MSVPEVVTFVLVSLVVICTPGQDTALTVRNTLVGGRTGGLWTAAGVSAGQAGWAVAAATGLAGLLSASEPAFLAVKIVGVGYLLYLAAQAFASAWRNRGGSEAPPDGLPAPSRWRALRNGLISNLGNPKMAAFFVSLLPQFAGRGSFVAMLVLGLLFCALTFGWLALYSVAVARARRWFQRPRVRRLFETTAGVVFVYLGVRLAAQER